MIFIVFSIILITLVIILLAPIEVKINFQNSDFDICFSYLFFKFNPKKKHSKNVNKKLIKGRKKSKSNSVKKVPVYFKIFKLIIPVFIMLFKKIKLKKIHLFLKISSNNAKNCALIYSYAYSFLKSIINILNVKSKINDLKIRVVPDFISSESSYYGELTFSISILDILSVLIYGTYMYIRKFRSLRE